MSNFDKDNPQTSFGAFKPVGNLVIVFDDTESAKGAQSDILIGGQAPDEISYMAGDEFVQLLDKMAEDQGVLAVLGSELRKTDEFRQHAEEGASFLIVYAPEEEMTKNVMAQVRSHDYRFALKYGHMLIERFDPSHPA